jgi:predicted signal transduction protein with EAL and GGDEF domain
VGVATCDPSAHRNDAMAQRDGANVETALRQADMAMYWAKAEGRGQYRFFDRAMDERLQQRVELEAEMKGAIESKRDRSFPTTSRWSTSRPRRRLATRS